jgi:hypothetical protein
MTVYAQNDLVQITRKVEVTAGTPVAGARDATYFANATFTSESQEYKSTLVTGFGAIHDVRLGMRSGNASLQGLLIYALNKAEIEDQMRSTFSAVVSAGPVNATFDNTGTHIDASAGPTIVAAATTFDDFIGAEGALLFVSGAGVAGPNKNWARAIKAIKPDGSQIDLEPLYVTGTGGTINEPLTDEGPVSATFTLGMWIRNMGIEGARYVDFEQKFTDVGTSFDAWLGCRGSGFSLSWEGQNPVQANYNYMAMDFNAESGTSIGNGTVTANAALTNRQITGGSDLTTFTYAGVHTFSGSALTAFSVEANGNAQGVDNVSGIDSRAGVTVGDLDFTGSMTIAHEGVKSRTASTISRTGGLSPLDIIFRDPDGNRIVIRFPKLMLRPTSPSGGAKGARVEPQFQFSTAIGSQTLRTAIIQLIPA